MVSFSSKSKSIGLPFGPKLAVSDMVSFSSKSKSIGLPFGPKLAVFERSPFHQNVRL